jgi:hypothetical protein
MDPPDQGGGCGVADGGGCGRFDLAHFAAEWQQANPEAKDQA